MSGLEITLSILLIIAILIIWLLWDTVNAVAHHRDKAREDRDKFYAELEKVKKRSAAVYEKLAEALDAAEDES